MEIAIWRSLPHHTRKEKIVHRFAASLYVILTPRTLIRKSRIGITRLYDIDERAGRVHFGSREAWLEIVANCMDDMIARMLEVGWRPLKNCLLPWRLVFRAPTIGIALVFFFLGGPLYGERDRFEGLRVLRININAYPPIKEDVYRRLIVQREGEPYSADKIRASISALNAAGKFNDIQVDAKIEGEGVVLRFILQPTFYIGIIDVKGVEKAFPPNRIIEAVNLPQGELYTRDKLNEATLQLDRFFRNNGFYETEIHTDLTFDEITHRANITFMTKLNRRARIGELKIVTSDPLDLAALKRAMKLKPHSKYTAEKVDRGQEKLRRELAKRNFLAASIRITDKKYDPGSNLIDSTVEVRAGSPVVITTRGEKISQKRLRKLVPIYEEASADRDLVEEGRRNIVNFYQIKGYFDTDVQVDISRNEKVDIEYGINKGGKHKLENITFGGNKNFTDEYLSDEIPIQKGGFLSPGVFNEDLLRRSTDNIKALYRNRGFEDVEVNEKVNDRGGSIDVHFGIVPGPRTEVEALDIEGNRDVSTKELLDQISLRPGSPFSERILADDRDHILAYYFDRGYPNASFDSQVERSPKDPHRVRVVYQIDEGNQVRIEQIYVAGNRHTKEEFVKETIKLHPGQPFSLGNLLEEESRLYNLGIFEQVQIVPVQPITEQKAESLLVQVREAKQNTMSVSVGFEANRRPRNITSGSVVLPERFLNVTVQDRPFFSPRGTFEFSRRNMRGRGETASFGARASRLQKRGVFSYADPRFLHSDWGSLFTLFSEKNSEIRTFTARRSEASFQVEKHPTDLTTLLFRYSFRRVSLSDIRIPLQFVLRQDQSARLSTLSVSWIRDSRDRPLDASTGKYLTADFGVTPKIIGSRSNFVRFLGQAAHYRPIIGSTVWANSVRVGLARPFGGTSDIPLSERFYTGGATTLRGFPTNEAGPQQRVRVPDRDLVVDLPIGGDTLFVVNSELRFPLPLRFVPSYKNLGGVLFYDGGNVYNRTSRPNGTDQNIIGLISRGFSHTVGFGLRFKTPVGPVRFDIGRNLTPVQGLGATQFFITLGQAF